MILMGIGDEAGARLENQIAATRDAGWSRIEMRALEVTGYPKANFHDISDAAFDVALRELEAGGLRVHCFGSAIMNWAKTVDTAWDVTRGELDRCIPRMKRLGTQYVRIMSFKPADDAYRTPRLVFERVREVTRRLLDEGLTPVHENCMNHGGMSWKHALELLEQCPGLKWVFDTANPVFNADRSKAKPWPQQDAWEFWENVREHVVHLHVKDATWVPAKQDADYNWPGEGQGHVRAILADAAARGYSGGVSIEPHMVVVFHDVSAGAGSASQDSAKANFVEYAGRLERLIAGLRSR